ncbi:MAG: hypothetical protein QXZ22_05320 [Sulfolobales archaeon]
MSSRRFVALPERLLVDAIKVAEKLGIPYTVLIERILTEVLKLMRYKKNLLESLAMVDAFDDVRRLGGVFLPEKSVVEMLSLANTEKLNEICLELTKMTSWYAELSKVKRSLTLTEVKNSLELWVPSARVDLVREGEGTYKFVVSFVNYSREFLELSKCIAEGLVRGYGLEEHELMTGPSVLVLRVGGLSEE